MKIQFWIEKELLPYLAKDVPHTIISESPQGLFIEMEVSPTAIVNLVFAAKAFGGDEVINFLPFKKSAA